MAAEEGKPAASTEKPTTSLGGGLELERLHTGWMKAMGIRVVRATPEEVLLELDVGEEHKQPLGLVHGAVYCGLIESGGSVGAMLAAGGSGRIVGTENQTSFLRAVRAGRLHSGSKPLHVGRTTQLWQTTVFDDQGRQVAVGQLRVLCLESEPLHG